MRHDKDMPVPQGDNNPPMQQGGALPVTMPVEAIAHEEAGSRFNPLQLLVYLVRYRLLIIVILALGVLAGWLVTLAMPYKYRSEAMIEIAPPAMTIMKDMQVLDEGADVRTLKTALEKLKSRELLRRVVHELGLTRRKDFLNSNTGFSFRALVSRATGHLGGAGGGNEDERPSVEELEQLVIDRLKDNLRLNLKRGTRIISISYSSTTPEYARRIPNQVANSYIASKLDQTAETSGMARQFIAEQVQEIKKKLEAAEKRLVAYAKEAGITLDNKEGSLIAANIKAINEALSEAIQERLKYERLVRMIRKGKSMQLPDVINSEAIQKYREKIVELRAQYRQKLRLFKPDYPEMRELKAQIDELQRLLGEDVRAIASSIELKYQVAVQKEKDLRRKLKELEEKQAEYQDKNITYTILKREVDSYRSQYQSLIDKLNKLSVAAEIQNKSASIVQYAVKPLDPYSPRLGLNLALALMLSAGLAGGLIFILEQLHNTFDSPDHLENELKLPVLGLLPKVPENKLAEMLADPRSSLSEAFYTLRTSLQFTGTESAPKTLLVTSTEPQEGKSTIATKLAESFGMLGMNVLLIDADMRKPIQHRRAGIPNTIGLSNLLTNTVPVTHVDAEVEIMRNTPWKNVWLVTAGTLPPNPANLLASQKMGMFVEACRQRFDIVIIDAPPVMGFADALLLSRLVEATMLVVAAKQASRKSVQGALKRLQSAGGYVVGTVMNRFEVDSIEYRYMYRYSNYGYLSYGYGDEDAANARASSSAGRTEGVRETGTRARLSTRRKRNRADGNVDSAHATGSTAGDPPQSPEHKSEDQPAE